MLKFRFYFLLISFIFTLNVQSIFAQVGINTKTPLGVFHVHSGDNAQGNSLGDLVVDNEGRVGVNVLQPMAKLDVVGNMSIKDGTEAEMSVLTSDDNGLGSWKKISYAKKVDGIIESNKLATLNNNRTADYRFNYVYSGAKITLDPGQWQIYFYCIYNNDPNINFTIWWDICEVDYHDYSNIKGRVLSYAALSNTLSPTYASFFVNPTERTTYYVHGSVQNPSVIIPAKPLYFTYHSGGRIWALPVY